MNTPINQEESEISFEDVNQVLKKHRRNNGVYQQLDKDTYIYERIVSLWEDIKRISKGSPSIIFQPDHEYDYLYEILVELGKMVREKYGRGYAYRCDISGVYNRNKNKTRR